ncbi:MAG: KamA family radical SAM protein [Deltaproteobacteria bacterium]|nr:KamA family radical SAM protein [Deltaproteobacteria bacterium]
MAVTPYYLSLIDDSSAGDPIAAQCLPDLRETDLQLGGCEDPLDEERSMAVPGLIHRYPDRCLVTVTSRCAVYCRHCNRKRRWQQGERDASPAEMEAWTDYVRKRPNVREVLLSGGDPFTIDLEKLDRLLHDFRSIGHVEILRIGTRMPVTMPVGIDDDLASALRRHRPLWISTQFNHPQEITDEAAEACERLLRAGIPIVNQSVLLRGVNDDYDTMRELLYGLERISVKPYYLFQCEPVMGAMHFRVERRKGVEMMDRLWGSVSGLCIPRFVYDLPGGRGKERLDGRARNGDRDESAD